MKNCIEMRQVDYFSAVKKLKKMKKFQKK